MSGLALEEQPAASPTEPVEPLSAPAPTHASIGESVFRGALALLSTQPLTWAASLVAAAFVPRLLGAQALGQLSLATSLAAVVGTAFGFGIPDYLVRRIAQRPDSRLADTALAFYIHTATSAVGALTIAAVAPFVASSALDIPLLYIALISVLIAPAQASLMAFFRGREKHVWYAWANAGQVVLVTAGGVAALIAGADVRVYALIGAALTTVSTLIFWKLAGFWPALPPLNLPLMRKVREFIRGGLPFAAWNLTLVVYGMGDLILLGFLVSSTEIGWYTAALRIVGVTVFIPTVIITPLFPALSRSVHEAVILRRAIAQTLRLALILTVPLGAGIFAIAPRVPALLGWSADFASAIPLMMILALHIPAVAIDMVLGTVLMAIGRERQWVRVGLIAAVVNIGLNLIAIPVSQHATGDGAIGASLIKVLTEVVMFVGALVVLPRHLIDPRIALDAGRVLVAGVATAVAAAAVLQFGIHFAVVAGAIAYVLVAVLVRAVNLEDARFVMRRFTSRKQSW